MAVPLVDLAHLEGLPLQVRRDILSRAYDETAACSIPSLLRLLEAEPRSTSRERFYVHRIAGDSIAAGAARLAQELTAEPISDDTFRQVRATLAETIASLRLSGLLPTAVVQASAPTAALQTAPTAVVQASATSAALQTAANEPTA